jgi:hypothetical protein
VAESLVNFGKKLAFRISLLHFQLGISLEIFLDALHAEHKQMSVPNVATMWQKIVDIWASAPLK